MPGAPIHNKGASSDGLGDHARHIDPASSARWHRRDCLAAVARASLDQYLVRQARLKESFVDDGRCLARFGNQCSKSGSGSGPKCSGMAGVSRDLPARPQKLN